ncbi:MAG: hypothetical protein QHH13_05925 [Melioribacter sp.]|uniref:hypothetical protein n=1 Tax=Rosettibacter primus TaxID=3111523 RepID=UPI00247EF12B|nr:hypothetical protein [Melioribacter sp.]
MKFIKVILILFLTLNYLNAQNCKSIVTINTNKIDAYIFINNNYAGKGNIITELDTGFYEIYIKEFLNKWNGSEFIDTIRIRECNYHYNFTFHLQESKSIKNILYENSIAGINNFQKNELSESNWLKILIGTSAVLGATAAYFKINADKKYDEYLSTGDKEILKRVNRLDLYSGIAFGLLQINFGYLIYKFLLE